MGYGVERWTELRRGMFAFVAMLAAGSAQGEPRACQMIQVNELPVIMHGNQPIVDVLINGHSVAMLIDTGSIASLLFPATAARLGLTIAAVDYANFASEIQIEGVGGGGKLGVAHLRELKIGNQTTRNTTIFVAFNGSHVGPTEGILGQQFLLRSDLDIDLKHNVIRFFKPKDCSGEQVIPWLGPYSVTPMRSKTDPEVDIFVALNGINVSATLDTGATNSVVTTAGAARAGLNVKALPAIGEMGGIGTRGVATFRGNFRTVGFGDEIIKNANLEVADLYQADKEVFVGSNIPYSTVDTTQMLLGADFFRSHHVYIARSQRQVYASYVGGPVFDPAPSQEDTIKPAPTP